MASDTSRSKVSDDQVLSVYEDLQGYFSIFQDSDEAHGLPFLKLDNSIAYTVAVSYAYDIVRYIEFHQVTIPRQSRGPSGCEPLKAAGWGR